MKLSIITMLAGCIVALAQGVDAAPQGVKTSSSGKIAASAIWQPPQDFISKAHSVCDNTAGPASFAECFINQMTAAGAPPAAVDFTRLLYKQNDGMVGIMTAFKKYGVVDAAQVFYPLRANDNYALLLVNGDPSILDVDDMQKLNHASMEQNPMFQAVKQQYPQTDVWPGDRSGNVVWPRTQTLPNGGTEFVVDYPLINGCHACRHTGAARFGWDFDVKGKLLRTTYIPTPPPPKLLTRPHAPVPQQPQQQQNP